MDGILVSAARTAIDKERAHQGINMLEAATFPHMDNQQTKQGIIHRLYERTGYYWEPMLPQAEQQREENKLDEGTLAFINSMI